MPPENKITSTQTQYGISSDTQIRKFTYRNSISFKPTDTPFADCGSTNDPACSTWQPRPQSALPSWADVYFTSLPNADTVLCAHQLSDGITIICIDTAHHKGVLLMTMHGR